MTTEQVLTRKEVAGMLKVSPHTLWRWERQGKIKPAFHLDKRPRYSIEEVRRIAKVKKEYQCPIITR